MQNRELYCTIENLTKGIVGVALFFAILLPHSLAFDCSGLAESRLYMVLERLKYLRSSELLPPAKLKVTF